MRRLEYLISAARSFTENDPVSTTNDIPDDEFIQLFNDAQDRLQSLISNTRETSKLFVVSKVIAAVANQEEYTINDRLFFNKAIEQIEYSHDGNLSNYQVLDKLSLFNRDTNTQNYPRGYYRARGKFYPIPLLSSNAGSFRAMFERSLDDLDKRRAYVSAVNGITDTTFTDITLTGASGTGPPDITSMPANFTNIDYICIVDSDGNVKAYNIPVGTFNTSTYVLTPRAGFTFVNEGETIEIGDYVVFNKYTTTHSTLPDECERYLLEYCEEGIFHRDSSEDFSTQSKRLARTEKEIIDVLKKQSAEIQFIPQQDFSEWY